MRALFLSALLLVPMLALSAGPLADVQVTQALTAQNQPPDAEKNAAMGEKNIAPRCDWIRSAQTPGTHCCCSNCKNSTLPRCTWCSDGLSANAFASALKAP